MEKVKVEKFEDDRGTFENLSMEHEVKRSYVITNFGKGVVRGLHGHKNEHKSFIVTEGAFKFVFVPMDDVNNESVETFTLSEEVPAIIHCPPGHYNGFVSLTEKNKLITFSSSSMEESMEDDYRLDPEEIDKSFWRVKGR